MRRAVFLASSVVTWLLLGCSGSNSSGSASGGSSAGGALSSGGSAGRTSSGGAGGGASPGTTSIEFSVLGGSYCMMSECGAGPSIGIQDAAGHALTLSTSCSSVNCRSCSVSACPGFFCQPTGIAVTGAQLDWNGAYYASSTCGAGMSCFEPTFAKPGSYTATMCATPGTLSASDGGPVQCMPSGPAKCGTVTFDFPSGSVAMGTVGP